MVYSFDLNMTPGASGIPQIVKLSQYDKTIPELQATLWLDNSGYSVPSGASIYIEGTKPDKTGFEYQLSGSGSTITIPITEQMTAVAGRVKCELIIRTSTGRKGSCNFFLDIEPAALDADIIPSETEIPIIEQIPEIVQEMENNVELAHQWATYGSESETPSETNNAKYWAEQSEQYAIGAFHWKGSVLFANIPTSGMIVGDLYDITDDFTTDSRFVEGAGIECAAGTDIVWSEGNKWDILTPATNASQVKYGDSDVKTELDQINTSLTDINADLSDILNKVYPIGCIIESTTCSTLALVKATYGGNNWIQHTGYMLRGATSGVTTNQSQKDGGSDSQSYTPSGTNSGGSVGNHILTLAETPRGIARVYNNTGGNWSLGLWANHGNGYCVTMADQPGYGSYGNGHSHPFTQPTFKGTQATIITIPNYKNVYIWERIS